MWNVEFDQMAEEEVFAAVEYYEKANPVIANQFQNTIGAAVEKLKLHPYFQLRYNQTHCLPLKKFPYMLHYQIEEAKNLVYIIGCIHTSLDPEKSWR
jgi:plasmid stabilization system protein ParE